MRGKRGQQLKRPPNPQALSWTRDPLCSCPSPPSNVASSPHLYPRASLPAPFPARKDENTGTCVPVQARTAATVLRAPAGPHCGPWQPYLGPPLQPCSPGTMSPQPASATSPAQAGPAWPRPPSGLCRGAHAAVGQWALAVTVRHVYNSITCLTSNYSENLGLFWLLLNKWLSFRGGDLPPFCVKANASAAIARL